MLNIADEATGYTPLFYAAMHINIETETVTQKNSYKTSKTGSTDTHVSVDMDDPNIINFMLDCGADLNKTAKFDKKALNVAAEYGNVYFLETCSEWCDKNKEKYATKDYFINAISTERSSVLLEACLWSQVEFFNEIKKLLKIDDSFVKLLKKCENDFLQRMNCLHCACLNGDKNKELIKMLLGYDENFKLAMISKKDANNILPIEYFLENISFYFVKDEEEKKENEEEQERGWCRM